MKGRIDAFDPRAGGIYRMTLTYEQPGHSVPGKTSEHSDRVSGGSWIWLQTSGLCNLSNSTPTIPRTRAP